MSFADVFQGGSQPSNSTSSGLFASNSSIEAQIADSVQNYQRNVSQLRDRLTDLRRKGTVTENDKRTYEAYVIDTKKLEDSIKSRMDSQMRSLEDPQLQRSVELVQKRTLLIKLSKDFDRVKASLTVIISESSTVRVGTRDDVGSSGSTGTGAGAGGQQQMLLQSQLVQGQDVDQMILEERHRDIVKMNQDLLLVKEMMGDMANIVEAQGELIDSVAAQAESSHGQAKEGLEQVKQAAKYQSSCLLS